MQRSYKKVRYGAKQSLMIEDNKKKEVSQGEFGGINRN